MMHIIVTTTLLLISAVHSWTISNPTPSTRCSRTSNAVDALVRQQQRRSPQQSQSRLFVLSASSTTSSTSTADTSTTTDVDCDQQQQQQQQQQQDGDGKYDYDECIIDEDRLLSDCAELESFISSATASKTGITTTTAFPNTDHTATATTDHSIMEMDTIYEQLHDDKGKSLLSTIIIPIIPKNNIPKNTDENKDESSTTTTTATATATVRTSRPAAPARPYYEFNKVIVNTMYTIISFLYPTTTTETTTTTTDDDYTIISLSQKEKQHIQQTQIQNQLRRNYEHFYILEIIARVPYFAYLSCMHLQETFGSRYTDSMNMNKNYKNNYDNTADQVRIEKMRLFYAQADNELHHLLIIEDLLGDNKDKKDNRSMIIAHSLATMYYWYTVFVYMTHGKVGEQAAYNLNELFVDRAYDTYNSFIEQNENELKKTSSSTSSASVSNTVPDIAHKYYDTDNQYLLNLLYYSSSSSSSTSSTNDKANKLPLSNLYDVFLHIRNDEKEHYNTLCKLQQQPQQQQEQE